MSHKLPDLPYDFGALEPNIDATTMEIHHDKHHQAYVTNLNNALDTAGDEFGDWPIEMVLRNLDRIPQAEKTAIRNNGGGHYNHSLYWQTLTGDGQGQPSGRLYQEIERTFGTYEKFQERFAQTAMTRFGSGWAWLADTDTGLVVYSTPNQDNPIIDGKGTPLLGLDVWEHAYYLRYQNRRPDYIKAWWNVVNWDEVESRYESRRAEATTILEEHEDRPSI
jgi:superoxide dismutase, Fe-Mn family